MEMGLGALLAAGDDVSTVWATRGRKGTAATFELGTMPGAETDIASTGDLPVALLAGRRGGVGAAYDRAGARAGDCGTDIP